MSAPAIEAAIEAADLVNGIAEERFLGILGPNPARLKTQRFANLLGETLEEMHGPTRGRALAAAVLERLEQAT